jgi:hypothetical protein
MPFPDPDERPPDERGLKLECSVLLALMLILLAVGVRSAWDMLSALL